MFIDFKFKFFCEKNVCAFEIIFSICSEKFINAVPRNLWIRFQRCIFKIHIELLTICDINFSRLSTQRTKRIVDNFFWGFKANTSRKSLQFDSETSFSRFIVFSQISHSFQSTLSCNYATISPFFSLQSRSETHLTIKTLPFSS